MGPNLTRLFAATKNKDYLAAKKAQYKLYLLLMNHGNALVEALEVAPDYGGEPTTAFGHEYREWQSATKQLLATLEREAGKP